MARRVPSQATQLQLHTSGSLQRLCRHMPMANGTLPWVPAPWALVQLHLPSRLGGMCNCRRGYAETDPLPHGGCAGHTLGHVKEHLNERLQWATRPPGSMVLLCVERGGKTGELRASPSVFYLVGRCSVFSPGLRGHSERRYREVPVCAPRSSHVPCCVYLHLAPSTPPLVTTGPPWAALFHFRRGSGTLTDLS